MNQAAMMRFFCFLRLLQPPRDNPRIFRFGKMLCCCRLLNNGGGMRVLSRLVLLIVVLSCLTPAAWSATAESAAMEFVQRRQLGANLRAIAVEVALRTQTFAIISARRGVAEARALLSQQLDYHAPQFQPQWNANLAHIYARHFSAEELRSLTLQGRNSPHIKKLADKQALIGAEMQRQSTQIMTAYTTAALNSAFNQANQK
jgi:hypothetical protein